MRKSVRLTRSLAAGLMLATAAGLASAATPKMGGTLTVGGGAGIRHLNPAVQSGSATGVPGTQIFAGLVRIDDKFKPHPYLAKSWEISDDGMSYTFKLVEGATFHDGKPITSEDVAFSLATVKENHPFGIAMFDAVETVETPDPGTAIIKLNKPHPALMQALAPLLMPVIPKHIYGDGKNPKTHPMNSTPVGSGPFKFKEWVKGQYLVLEKNENFFIPGRPYLDQIVIKFIKETSVRMLALEKGEVDYYPFTGVRFRDVPRLEKNASLNVTSLGYEALGPVNYIEFNMRKPPFDDKRVRQAVAYAIDQDFMVKTLFGNVPHPGYSPFYHASPYHSEKVVGSYSVNLDKANALLDEAGLKPDSDGIRLKVTLDYPTFHSDSLGTGSNYVKSQLKKVGIDVSLRKPADFPSWAKQISSWDYEFTMNDHWNYPDPVIGVHRIYLCGNIKKTIWSNTQGYCNERVDALLQEAGATLEEGKRKALYAEFQDIVNDELPLYFLNEEPYVTVYTKALKNPPLTVWGGMQPMDEVWLDR
jgi:peptide/nickel transport system substrate-binding protein